MVDGDEVLWLPPVMPAGWTPVKMVEEWGEIRKCKPGVAKSFGVALVHKDSVTVEEKRKRNRWDKEWDTLVLKPCWNTRSDRAAGEPVSAALFLSRR